jgi:hypothetical protein
MPVGLSPQSATEVNTNTGTVCRQFEQVKNSAHTQAEWLLGTDLTAEPYLMSPEDQTAIKSAINTLDSALQGVDMTFIDRLLGLPI